ncbi:hypothetical protein SMSKK35_2218 [Stenotrophomonas maltophilia SKK35]|nr:hypothetical protein SMSKK35_2218 [Stenotrophomonas maltophilia SKK35]
MEGKGGSRQIQCLGNVAGKLPGPAGLDQQSEDGEAGGMSKGSQSNRCDLMFHDSRIVEQ